VLVKKPVLERDVLGRRVDAVHDVGLEHEGREDLHPHRLEQVVGDRFGDRHRRPGYFALKAAIACRQGVNDASKAFRFA
jgi:hypothetical protein